ncbi:MAG: hypothetical protein IRZ29_03060 [Thermoflavifilum sp.]|nr:hypothetical protein [Thermoflavifilum sp.]
MPNENELPIEDNNFPRPALLLSSSQSRHLFLLRPNPGSPRPNPDTPLSSS